MSDKKEPIKVQPEVVEDSTALAPTSPRAIVERLSNGPKENYIERFYQGKDKATIRSYGKSLSEFARFLGVENLKDVADVILATASPIELLDIGEKFKEWLRAQGLRATTINARLVAVRSFCQMLQSLGSIAWTMTIEDETVTRDRERTLGPEKDQITKVLNLLLEDKTDAGLRDLAILTILLEFALRRNELSTLKIENIDDASTGIRLNILGKKRKEREWTPNRASAFGSEIIRSWIKVRGNRPGPLIISFKPAKVNLPISERGLSGHGIWQILQKRAVEAGVEGAFRPHGLRHAAITNFLETNQGDLRAAMAFARHRNINTTVVYDDLIRDAVKDKAAKAANTWWNKE